MAALFTTSLAYSAVLPVLPLILQRSGFNARAVTWHTGMLTGVYMLCVFLFAPLWGRASDRIGRRPLIVVGLTGMMLTLLSFALFRSLALAYTARALTGVFVGAVIPVATAEVGDISALSSRAHRFALLTSASLLGFLIGPTLSGSLTNAGWVRQTLPGAAGTYVAVIAAAALSGLAAVAVALWLPTTVQPAEQTAAYAAVRYGSILQRATPALLVLIVMYALASFEVAITLRGQQRLGWSPAQIELLFAGCSTVMIIIQDLLFSMLIKHVPSGWLIGPGLGAMVIGLTLMPLTASYGLLLLLVMLTAAGASIVVPVITYWASIGAGLAQGAALGMQTAASSLGTAHGSAAVAATFGISPAAPFWLAATLFGAGAALLANSRGASLRTASAKI